MLVATTTMQPPRVFKSARAPGAQLCNRRRPIPFSVLASLCALSVVQNRPLVHADATLKPLGCYGPAANEPAPAGISVDRNRTRDDVPQCCPSTSFLWLQQDCITIGGGRCVYTCICVGPTQPGNPLNTSSYCGKCSHVVGMDWCGHISNDQWELYQRIDDGSGSDTSAASLISGSTSAPAEASSRPGVTIAGPQTTTSIAGLAQSSASIETVSTTLSPGITSPSPTPSGSGTALNSSVIGAVIGAITLVLVGLGIAYAIVQRRRRRPGTPENTAYFSATLPGGPPSDHKGSPMKTPSTAGEVGWTRLAGNSILPPQPAPPIALVAPAARIPTKSQRVPTPEAEASRQDAISLPQSVTPSGIPSPPAMDPTPPPAHNVGHSETRSRGSASDPLPPDDAVVISPGATAFYAPQVHVPPARDSVDTESLIGFIPRGGSLVSRAATTATATSTVSRKFVGYEDTAS